MAESIPTEDPVVVHAEAAVEEAKAAASAAEAEIKSRFAQAIDDARANAEELTAAAREKATATAAEWTEQAGAYASQARDKSIDLAHQGKAKASEAIANLGRTIADTAPVIDEKLGVHYGDYARAAADALGNSAGKLAEKDFEQLGEEVKEFVRKSPATALGIAAVTGFFVARLFSRSGSSDA